MFTRCFTKKDVAALGFKKIYKTCMDYAKVGILKPEDVGCLIKVKFLLENPNNKKRIYNNDLLRLADSNAQFERLCRNCFIITYQRPSSIKIFQMKKNNKFYYTHDADSIPRQDNVYYFLMSAKGDVIDVKKNEENIDRPLPSALFFMVPDPVITSNVSNLALYLYVFLLSIKNNVNFSKEDIMDKTKISKDKFNKAWKELKDAGFLTKIEKHTQKGIDYDWALNCKPKFPTEIKLTNNDVDNLKTSSFFASSLGTENVVTAKSSPLVNIDNSICSFIANKYCLNKYSSIETTFDDELKSVLKQIKKRYCALGNPQNIEFVDTLNRLIFNKYKGKYVDLKKLVITYKTVLSLYEKSFYKKIVCMNAYCKKIICNNFFELRALDHEIRQDYDEIKNLLAAPLELIRKDYKAYYSNRKANETESDKSDKREFDFYYWDLEHTGESAEEYIANAEELLGFELPKHAKKNWQNTNIFLRFYFEFAKKSNEVSIYEVMRELCKYEVERKKERKLYSKKNEKLKIVYDYRFSRYCLDYDTHFKGCPVSKDDYDLEIVLSGREPYRWHKNLIEKLKKWNPNIEQLFDEFDKLRTTDERFKMA